MRDGCAAFEHELSSYLDGELPAAERTAVESHLHQCAACRAEIRELRRVGETLRRWDAQETRYATSTGFRNRVLASIGANGAGAPPEEVRTWRFAAFAAAAAACAVAAFSWNSVRDSGERPADIVQIEARVLEMERKVADLRGAVPSGAAVAQEPIDVARLGAVPSVVREPSADAAAEVGVSAEDPWEARADGMLLRDAVDSYEQFSRERTGLLLEELRAKVDRPGNAAAAATTAALPAPTTLGTFLAQVQVVPVAARPFERVQIWPIEGGYGQRTQRLLLLEQAIDERILSVTEDESGAVVAVNGDLKDRPVLLLAGDVLKGGRRDRVLLDDVLLAPGRHTSLPALGASEARPKTSYRRFTQSRLLAPADLRAFLATGRIGAEVTQKDVDQIVDASLTVTGSRRGGGEPGLENLLTNPELEREVSRYVLEFRKRLDRPNVVGFAVAAGPDLIGIELCGDTETFRALRDRLIRSHVLYALSRPGTPTNDAAEGGPPADAEVRALLAEARTASFDEPPATGDGSLWVFRSLVGRSFGYGLAEGSRVIHATVFADLPAGCAADVAAGRTARGTPAASSPGPRSPSSAPDRADETPRGTGVGGR